MAVLGGCPEDENFGDEAGCFYAAPQLDSSFGRAARKPVVNLTSSQGYGHAILNCGALPLEGIPHSNKPSTIDIPLPEGFDPYKIWDSGPKR